MKLPPAALCASLAAIAGCGDDEGEPERLSRVAAGAPIRVTAKEYAFDPGRIVVTGKAEELRITLDNRGTLAHNLKLLDGERELGGTQSFPPGERRSARVPVQPGTYRFVCTVADHRELGMEGELEVGS